MSQLQQDGLHHPVAYAGRSLSAAERNYGITELETLAVVWAMSHYRSYLYGQDVTVYTDHSAVNSPSGKDARWWTKVCGAGIRNLKILHRSRFAVPKHLTGQVLDVCHRGPHGGHFSVNRTYKSLAGKWWWEGMYGATENW